MDTTLRLGMQAESLKKVTDLIPQIQANADQIPLLIDEISALGDRLARIEDLLKNLQKPKG